MKKTFISKLNLIKKETGYFKSFDETLIYFETRGEGEPLIFIYGIGCPMNHWRKQLKFLSRHYKTIAIDLRGHNKSFRVKNEKSMKLESIAKDIRTLLKIMKIKKAIFLGHSFGVQVLVFTYTLYPNFFKASVFINGFISNPLKPMYGGRIIQGLFYTLKISHKLFPKLTNYFWKLGINNTLTLRLSALLGGFNLHLTATKDIEIYLRGVSMMNLGPFLFLFEDMMNYDAEKSLKKMKIPCLILGGKKDTITSQKTQKKLHHLLPVSELSLAPKGTHCTILDRAQFVNDRINLFLKRLS